MVLAAEDGLYDSEVLDAEKVFGSFVEKLGDYSASLLDQDFILLVVLVYLVFSSELLGIQLLWDVVSWVSCPCAMGLVFWLGLIASWGFKGRVRFEELIRIESCCGWLWICTSFSFRLKREILS